MIEFKLWCEECGDFLARHRAIRREGRTEYGWLELAPGMVNIGKRTYGPSPTRRSRPRSATPLMVKKPGPITLHCLRCGTVRETTVGLATMLVDSKAI